MNGSSGNSCIHCTYDDDDNSSSFISSSTNDKDSFCVQCFQDLFEKRVNVNSPSSGQIIPSYIKSKPPPVPPKPGKGKDNHTKDNKEYNNIITPPTPTPTPTTTTTTTTKSNQFNINTGGSSSFVCYSCDTTLHGKTVESRSGKVYCTDCFVKVIQKLSCHHCGEIITPDTKQIIYKSNPWHQNCFRCTKCNDVIGEKSFCKPEPDRGIFCEDCYFETSGKKCIKCKKILTSTGFMFRDQPWHKDCFTCTQCQHILDAATEIFCKEDQPYCSSCYDELYLEKCTACKKSLRGEIVEYQNKQFHEDCFCCDSCKLPIGSNSFFPRENHVFCQTCFCIQFGKMCKKCGLTISPENAMGIVYQEEHWHRDCFGCTHCDKSLVGIPIHSTKDHNQPYCGECYDEIFGKRCAGCTKIISGVIGSKFITYEERHWHTDCFNCKLCQTSLANRKFCPSGKDIYCGPCVKYRIGDSEV